MLRLVYIWILRFHPRAFRDRFAEEMLYVFDQARQLDTAEALTSAKLLGDGLLSLTRQWTLRSKFWKDQARAAPTLTSGDGVPAFYVLDGFKPRSSALIHGAVLSVAVFFAVVFAMKYSINHRVYFAFPVVASDDRSSGPELRRAIIPTETGVGPDQSREKTAAPPPSGLGDRATSDALPDIKAARAARSGPEHSKKRLKGNPSGARDLSEVPARRVVIESEGQSLAQGPPPMMLSEELLSSYTGTYITPDQLRVSVTLAEGTLMIEIAGQAPAEMVALSETKFLCRMGNGCSAEFLRNHDGTVKLEIYQSGRRVSAYRQ